MSNQSYWANRAAQDMVNHMGTAEQTASTIERAAKKAGKYLKDETRKIFAAFQDFGISEKEARTLLRSCKHGSVADRLRRAGEKIKDPEKRQAFLDALSSAGAYHWRIQRIENLNEDIDRYVKAYRQLQRTTVKETLGNVARSSYYHTIFNLQQETGLGFSFSTFSRKEVESILKKNWCGSNYSKRIWNNTNQLAAQLKDELLVSAMTGRSTEKTSRVIADTFHTSMYKARRLVRTESAYVAGEATDMGYDEAEIDDYIFVATLDSKTSKKCAEKDGKTFHRKDKKPGTNYPPLHPWCRSTTIASFGPDTLKNLERRARDKDGKPIKVPADMTYNEWAKKYCPEALEFDKKYRKKVDNSEKNGKIVLEDKIKNGKITLKLCQPKQKAHMEATREEGKSYFTISDKELQQLIYDKHGTGKIRVTASGQIKETIVLEKDIGFDVDPVTKVETPTNKFTIHYSKTRTHAVPSGRDKTNEK